MTADDDEIEVDGTTKRSSILTKSSPRPAGSADGPGTY
jgi:hypothetical protein